MAFLRFHRDKRGYEHFYLVESTTSRRGKTRARLLYWFRSPPNVKVGREPFDEDVRRALEAQNPGVTFDWRKISETPIPSADAERWRERRRLERAQRAARRAAGEEPEIGEPEDEGAEVPENAEPDVAVDAAEQQADALAPTEESLVSTAATIEPPPLRPEPVRRAESTTSDRQRSRRRRRRRGRRPEGGFAARQEAEPREPGPPLEPADRFGTGGPSEIVAPSQAPEPHDS